MCLLFCYCVIQGVSFNYHHRNVRSRGLGLELPGLGLGIGFYDKVSVSSRNLSQVSVSEVTVSTTSLENYLTWTNLRPNSRLSQKQNVIIDAFTMVNQSSYRYIKAIMNNLQLIILHCLAAKKSWVLDWSRCFCDCSISSHSI